jgi:hypothetical protein
LANILFTWELGGNLGHLATIQPLMRLAAQQGHTLSVALKNLRYAQRVLGDMDFRCFQAPFRSVVKPRSATRSLSYAHTLEDFCFSDSEELSSYIRAWQEIFAATQPDVVFYDFSPGALIASHGANFGKLVLGNGFMTPPTVPIEGVFAPFATTPRDPTTLHNLRRHDQRLLQVLNDACQRCGLPRFDTLGDIYTQADHTLRLTLPEMDQFGARKGETYLGIQPSFGTAAPTWPRAGEHKVFCYLQDFPGLGNLLQELSTSKLAVLVYGRDLPPALLKQFGDFDNIAFTSEPVNLEAVARDARFVVHHASSGTAAQFFLLGIPQLCVPTQQEQLLLALQLDRAGVAVTAPHNQRSFAREIHQLLREARFTEQAQYFRKRYAHFSWEQSEASIRQYLAQLLASRAQA